VADALHLDRLARLKAMPVALALPWGLDVGDFAGHLPLPAKIRVEVLEPIDVRARFPGEADVEPAYEYVTLLMQEKLIQLSAESVLPPLIQP
jgi:hypothetical protein